MWKYILGFFLACNLLTVYLFVTAKAEPDPFDVMPSDEDLAEVDQIIKELDNEEKNP